MGLIEVKILEFTLVLLVDIASTVAEITSLAINEYLSFEKKKTPKKVLYTIDEKGRILSGGLKIIEHGLSSQLEVVVQDYSTNDFVYSNQVESLYREWQVWTVNQLKEHLQLLSHQEIPSYPDEQTLHLLYELGGSRHERVQSLCVKALQLLMTKFNQKKLVIESADQLSMLFSNTKYPDVAISVLESFKGLSSMQARVFDSSAYIKNMFNIQHALTRFTAEKQSMLFEAFTSVSAVLGDQELMNVIANTASTASRMAEQQASIVDDMSNNDPSTYSNNPLSSLDALSIVAPSTKSVASDPSRKNSGISFKRLETLLTSDDPKVRLFALEKLNKLLKDSRKAQVVKKAYPPRVRPILNGSVGDATVEGRSEVVSEIRDQSTADDDDVGKVIVATSLGDRGAQQSIVVRPSAPVMNRRDVESLLVSLLTCLKRSIKGRDVGKRQRSKLSSGEGINNGSSNSSDNGQDNKQPTVSRDPSSLYQEKGVNRKHRTDQTSSSSSSSTPSLSIAGRLIELAFEHSETDHTAIQLAIDCIWHIIHYNHNNNMGVDTNADTNIEFIQKLMKFKVTGDPLTSNQIIFLAVAMPWQKLLLTLSHCTESNQYSSHHYHDLAEKCAYCFLLLLLNNTSNTAGTTANSQVSLYGFNIESPAISSFLMTSKPSFRSYLALSYLKYLSTNVTSSHTNISEKILTHKQSHHHHHHHHHHDQQHQSNITSGGDEELNKLKELLIYNNYSITRWLWQWAVQSSDGSRRRKSAVLALDCLSSSCVFSEVNRYLVALDPINR